MSDRQKGLVRKPKDFLKTERIKKGYTVKEVATYICVSEQTLRRYEKDIGKTPAYEAVQLLKLYSITV